MNPFGNGPGGPFDNNTFVNPFKTGLDPLFDRSLTNLERTLDPRDQLAENLRRFRQTGVGDVGDFLNQRLGQVDPRDQEAQDLRNLLNRVPRF